jgi:hypothetical protein
MAKSRSRKNEILATFGGKHQNAVFIGMYRAESPSSVATVQQSSRTTLLLTANLGVPWRSWRLGGCL